MTKDLSASVSISIARLKFSTIWSCPASKPATVTGGEIMVRKVR